MTSPREVVNPIGVHALVWVGDTVTTDIACDLVLGDDEAESEGADRIKRLLQDKGVLFRPW
mgnify:CR=1 FL=1